MKYFARALEESLDRIPAYGSRRAALLGSTVHGLEPMPAPIMNNAIQGDSAGADDQDALDQLMWTILDPLDRWSLLFGPGSGRPTGLLA